ncbi:hypothetical protein [Halarchaeum salinum]|uniref:Helix-turn-helix domain-containing protein n=1 Tax=Halarchaeum salinum TaxID=489912 RepID=A0AAV3SA17_9EURY
MPSGKPAHIQLRGTSLKSTDCPSSGPIPAGGEDALNDVEFETAGMRDGARALLRHWEDAHGNFSEIARRSGWSPPHIRRVYDQYFEAADEDGADEIEVDDVAMDDLSASARELYRRGYRDGFADGFEEAKDLLDGEESNSG